MSLPASSEYRNRQLQEPLDLLQTNRHPSPLQPFSLQERWLNEQSFCNTFLLSPEAHSVPASICRTRKQGREKKKSKKAAVEASTSIKISTAWRGRVPSTQANHSALLLGQRIIEKSLQPLTDTNPCLSFLSHQNCQRSIFLGLTQLPAAARLTGAARLPWASGHMLHFSGKAPKKILTQTIFFTDCLWHRKQNML